VRNLEEGPSRRATIWLSLQWCLPSLLGFLAFLFAFPIDRKIPFWPHLSIAEVFILWFLFITPITTVIAIITLLKSLPATRATGHGDTFAALRGRRRKSCGHAAIRSAPEGEGIQWSAGCDSERCVQLVCGKPRAIRFRSSTNTSPTPISTRLTMRGVCFGPPTPIGTVAPFPSAGG
jgi:hypothetical protein